MARQYPDFNALKESFNGLVDVIGIPCTQFLNVSLTEKNQQWNIVRHPVHSNKILILIEIILF